MEELEAIIKWAGNDRVHLFGISIGAWIGLNAYILKPQFIKSYLGYGNLAPYHKSFKDSILEFKKCENFLNEFKNFKQKQIDSSNWMTIFEQFYIPFFFPELKALKSGSNSKKIMARIIFPIVKGNKIDFFYDYYQYLTKTIIQEGEKLLKKIDSHHKNVPVFFMNGKKDIIANPIMTYDLNKKFPHSRLKIFENLGHGSILLGKGNNKIMESYVNFLNL